MKHPLLAFLAAVLSFLTVDAHDITGTWSGILKINPQNSMRLVFHIAQDSITMDSPDQNAYGIEGQLRYLSDDSLSMGVTGLRMNFTGKLINDSLVGTFRQGPFTLPLTLAAGVKRAKRPQTPQPPFPYTTEDVTITAPEAVLSGTLVVPEHATKPTPVVVLVSGSGQQNRDEELFEHKPFAVIADYLARRGIASLRYDDRGYGKSKGLLDNATTSDFAEDARAVVNYLHQSGRFDRIGMIGHSEGGMIACMLGAEPGVLDFIVSIAGPAVSGAEINAYQNKIALINSGIDSLHAEQFETALLKALRYRLTNTPLSTVSDEQLLDIYPQRDDSPVTRNLGNTITATLTMTTIQPWMEYFLRFDPAHVMSNVKIPAMIIYGEKDCQVPPSLNIEPAKRYIPTANVRSYPELNHLMQHAKTGNVDEYKNIEETFSEEVLSDITTFIPSSKE